jgi:hypothetical protein
MILLALTRSDSATVLCIGEAELRPNTNVRRLIADDLDRKSGCQGDGQTHILHLETLAKEAWRFRNVPRPEETP